MITELFKGVPLHGVISSAMDVSISEGVVCIAFRDASPAKVNDCDCESSQRAVGKAQEESSRMP